MNSSEVNQNYYVHTKRKWLKLYHKLTTNKKIERLVFREYFDSETFLAIKNEILLEFEDLLPQIPYIGGIQKERFVTNLLVFTALSLSLYRVLKRKNFTLHQIGKIIYDIGDFYYSGLNYFTKLFMRRFYLSKKSQERVKISSDLRRKEANPANYQGIVVEGDGKNLLWGFDYTECGGLKFLQSQDAEELAPYICLSDYSLFRAINVGFKRTKNLAIGGDVCNFRFLRSYQTPKGWPPEQLEEYKSFINKESCIN